MPIPTRLVFASSSKRLIAFTFRRCAQMARRVTGWYGLASRAADPDLHLKCVRTRVAGKWTRSPSTTPAHRFPWTAPRFGRHVLPCVVDVCISELAPGLPSGEAREFR